MKLSRTMLYDEIQSEFECLKKLQVGTDEYRTTVEGLTKLVDRAIELEKLDEERFDKAANRDIDNDFKQKQLDDEKKERVFKNIMSVVGVVVPSCITIWGTLKSLKFEETGTVTTIMGRGFINKLLPKNK